MSKIEFLVALEAKKLTQQKWEQYCGTPCRYVFLMLHVTIWGMLSYGTYSLMVHVILWEMLFYGACLLMGQVVLWGMSSHGAYCPWGILSLGHVVSGGILSLGHIVSGGILSWGIMSCGISSWRQIVLEAFRLGAYCLGACRLTTGNDNHGDVVNDVRRQGGFERNIRKKINNGDYGRREKYDKRRGGLDAYNRRGYVRHGGGQKCFFT